MGCSGGYAGRTAEFRVRLDSGNAPAALAEIDQLVAEAASEAAAGSVDEDYPLLLLERATLYQAVGDHRAAVADFAAADQMMEILDLTPEGASVAAEYLWSDDAGLYRPPIYEKLMINIAAMASYLAMGDFSGARVEARRLTVLTSFFETTELAGHPMMGAADYLAGLVMELSGERAKALRYYLAAARIGDAPGLDEAIVRLSVGTTLAGHSEVAAARERLGLGSTESPPEGADSEVVVIVFSGLAPRREAERFPIGLVFGWVGSSYHYPPHYGPVLDRIEAEDLVTWINFPVLVAVGSPAGRARVSVDGQQVTAELLADVESFALAEWERERPGIAFAAITRAVTRILVREAIQAATDESREGYLLSLLVQGGMQVADTPDTRTWTSMPAQIQIARVAVEPGPVTVGVTPSGATGPVTVEVPGEGAAVVVVRLFN